MIAYVARQFTDRISYLVSLHGVSFAVTATASATVAEDWVNLTLNCNAEAMRANQLVVSLGLQVRPPNPATGEDGRVTIMHLCMDRRCLIYQFSRAQSVPPGLRQLLLSRACVFVGFENLYHRSILRMTPHQVMLGSNPVDLRMLLMRLHPEVSFSSTEIIFERLLGIPGVTVNPDVFFNSNWEAETLSEAQILEVCVEARCCVLLGRQLQAWRYR